MCAQFKGGANEDANFESGHGAGALPDDTADGGAGGGGAVSRT